MKFLRLVFVLGLLAPGLSALKGASAPVSVRFYRMFLPDVLKIYQLVSGKPVAASNEVLGLKAEVSFTIEKKTPEEALRIIEDALVKQAGVEIAHAQDGSAYARKIIAKK